MKKKLSKRIIVHMFPAEGEGGSDESSNSNEDSGGSSSSSGDSGAEDTAALKAELEKYKKDVMTLRKKVKSSEPAKPDNSELLKKDEELAALAARLKQLEDEKETASLKNKDEKDRELFSANKRIRELEASIEKINKELADRDAKLGDTDSKYSRQLSALRQNSLESEILIVSEQLNALRPSQIVGLTKGSFIWDDDLDRWIHPIRNKKGEIIDGEDVKEYLTKYLGSEENDNLIRAGVKSGTGEPPSSSSASVSKEPASKPASGKIVIDKVIEREAMMRDLKPEVWAELKQIRKDMLEKKKKGI